MRKVSENAPVHLALSPMFAADLQLRMGAATRNLSMALQQCDIKQNMAIRSKLVSGRMVGSL